MRGYLKANYSKVKEEGKKPKIISYRIGVSLGRDPKTKKYQYIFETIKTGKRAAETRLAELIHLHDTGKLNKPGKGTVAGYLKSWLDDNIQHSLSARTHELYSYISNKHLIPALGDTLLTDLKAQQLQELYSEKMSSGLGSRTVQLCHIVMHKCLKNAVRTNVLMHNVADVVDKPKVQRPEMHPMNEAELGRFLEAAKKGPYYPLFFTYLFTGMRRGELLATRWRDVDLLSMEISISRSMQYLYKAKPADRISFKEPKSKGSRRLIDLGPANAVVLREHLAARKQILKSLNRDFDPEKDFDQNELVFCHCDGTPMLPDGITHAWANLAKRTGLPGVRLHDARHTMATLMLQKGIHPKIVQERLGHASIKTTLDTYSAVVAGLQAAAAKSLEEFLPREQSKLEKDLAEVIQK